jgi:hypothetical protein
MSKLEAVLPDDYDEDAATAAALAASLAGEEAKWSWLGLEDIVQLSVMVAEHAASLPPPPLPPNAPPQARGTARRFHRLRHRRHRTSHLLRGTRSQRMCLLGRSSSGHQCHSSTSSPTTTKTTTIELV